MPSDKNERDLAQFERAKLFYSGKSFLFWQRQRFWYKPWTWLKPSFMWGPGRVKEAKDAR